MRILVGLAGVASLVGLLAIGELAASARAPAPPPDFSVSTTLFRCPRPGAPVLTLLMGRQAAPPPPTRSAPLEDGSAGPAPGAPKLTPYMERWRAIRKSRIAGSSEFDPRVRCVPSGMPTMMNMFYGMEIMQSRDKIAIYSEME